MTDHDPYPSDNPPPPSSRARRSAEVWAAARADYLAGASASEVCERHDLALSTFRWRAQQEGWRRLDQSGVAAPFHVSDDPGDYRNWLQPTPTADDLDAWPAETPSDVQTTADEAPDSDTLDPASPAELAEKAWFNAALAIARGRLIEARGWTRLHRELAVIAKNLDGERMRRVNDRLARNLSELRAATGALRSADHDGL